MHSSALAAAIPSGREKSLVHRLQNYCPRHSVSLLTRLAGGTAYILAVYLLTCTTSIVWGFGGVLVASVREYDRLCMPSK